MSESEKFDDMTGVAGKTGKNSGFIKGWMSFFSCFSFPALTKKGKDREFFITTAQELIANNTQDAFIIDTSRKLLVQQRIMDDTKARRRLERWARNTIICYLMTVFALVVANGISQIIWPEIFKEHGFISDTVMTVILSTTTINIIGLGVIVLRGHFPSDVAERE